MITSIANQQIKNIVKLNKSTKFRKEQGVFIVEGIRMFQEVPKERLVDTYVTEAFYEKHAHLFTDVPFCFVSETVFKEISDTMTPQGVLAVVKQQSYKQEDLLQGEHTLIMVLEQLQDPGNLGTIIRTGEGAGVTGVLMSKDTVDIYNPKVVRSTMGSIYRMPHIYAEDIKEAVIRLKEAGVKVYGAHLKGEPFYHKDYQKPTAFLIGNEGNGLTDALSDLADEKIKIPMCGQVESLNAAVAASVLMYESFRQRN